ncbi:class IV adenylate cyclase [Edaphobacter modestus]|uniref:Adenylate cyclase n=1 Tax=Edaphobacter modestus TaxID=388466 RepID=A0A4Q7Z210_9BACT|nr:class IV adenylate cyclase [Edaphobacter modestus]RZU43549.1 adenylate cyclase [Edaphobacter modestus]
MSNAEIELKLPISDPAAFQSRLLELGFHIETRRTFEHNTLYDTPSRDLRARTEILRIRQYGNTYIVTHKGLADPHSAPDSTRYKVRIETETTVGDGPTLAAIFEHLGYAPAFVYEKYRTEWSHASEPSAHVVVDETPIGTYAELEGPPDWIERTLSQLSIDPATCLTDSYGKLFLDWKQRTGSTAENLTFAEIGAPALV